MSTLKLTDEQINILLQGCDFDTAPERSIASACDAYAEMIQESKTHRIVEAPEGQHFEPGTPSVLGRYFKGGGSVEYCFATTPIPAPCPPPKLDPLTVEQVYGDHLQEALRLCAGKEAVFGQVSKLQKEGFTEAINSNGELSPIFGMLSDIYRICLRKWPA